MMHITLYTIQPSSKSKSKYIIYALCDPITDEVRYIGKSCSGLERPKDHFALRNLKTKSKKNSWIKNVMKKGTKPKIRIFVQFGNSKKLDWWEMNFIQMYNKKGRLTNMTKGGTGGNTGGSWKKWRPVIATNLKTGEKTYYLFVQATRFHGFEPNKVSAVCQGKRYTHKKHKFEYVYN